MSEWVILLAAVLVHVVIVGLAVLGWVKVPDNVRGHRRRHRHNGGPGSADIGG